MCGLENYYGNKCCKKYICTRKNTCRISRRLKKLGTIPEVVSEKDRIEKASEPEYWAKSDFFEIEKTRTILRELMKYIDNPPRGIYTVDIIDELIVSEKKEGYNIQER